MTSDEGPDDFIAEIEERIEREDEEGEDGPSDGMDTIPGRVTGGEDPVLELANGSAIRLHLVLEEGDAESVGMVDPGVIGFEGPDGAHASLCLVDPPESYGAEDTESDMTDVSGVGSNKAAALYRAGYETVADLRRAGQQDLADVEGIGNALAARIKADVGDSADETGGEDIEEAMVEMDVDADEIVAELESKMGALDDE